MAKPWEAFQKESGAKPWEAFAKAKPTPTVASPAPQESPSIARQGAGFLGNVLAGGIEPMMAMASGAVATPLAGLAGLAAPLFGYNSTDTVGAVQRNLTYPPQSEAGQLGLRIASLPMRIPEGIGSMIGEGMAGAAQRAGLPAPVSGMAGVVGETMGQAIPSMIGLRTPEVKTQAGNWSLGTPKTRTLLPEINPLGKVLPTNKPPAPPTPQQALKMQTAAEARNAGFLFVPTTVQKSWLGTQVETIGKKMSRESKVSEKNQNVRNELIAKDLGLPPGTPLTVETLNAVVERELDAYKNLASAQMPPVEVTTPPKYAMPWNTIPTTAMRKGGVLVDTDKFVPQIEALAKKYGDTKQTYPGGITGHNTDYYKAIGQEFLQEHDPAKLLQAIIDLRNEAKTNLKGTPAYPQMRDGQFAYDMSLILEDMFGDALKNTGRTDLLAKYQQARQTIAKARDVMQSVDLSGNVLASKLVQLEKAAAKKGDPHFTGGLKLAADFADAFPDANKALKGSTLQHSLSPYDLLVAGSEMLSGNPGTAVLGAAQFGARATFPSLAASEWFQKRYANPIPQPTTSKRNIAARAIPIGMAPAAANRPPAPKAQGQDIIDYLFSQL